jgi:uroporphyrinogen decarboxylase
VDSRERVHLALNHERVDRVPVDFWASSGTRRKIEAAAGIPLSAYLDAQDVDLRYIEGPRYIGPPLSPPAGATDIDIWGVPRIAVAVTLNDGTGKFTEVYKEVKDSPLREFTEPEQILAYPYWPSPDWFDYGDIEAQCDRVHSAGRVAVFMGDRLNRLAQLKPAMYLRGTEQILVDLAVNPEIAVAIFGKISSFYLEYGRRILESARGKIDILCTGDDFGSQNGLLISPKMWNQFIRSGFNSYIALGHAHGARVMHHSCGSVYALIPDLIDCGLDILQSLQPEASLMEPERLKQEFGGVLSFQGGISIQKVLPRGKPTEVEEHVKSLFTVMAPGGGYIAGSSHNIQADTPFANIKALFEAYRTFGSYDLCCDQ